MAMNIQDGPVAFDVRPAPGGVPRVDSGRKFVSVSFLTSTELTTGSYSEFTWTLNPGIPVMSGETHALCFASEGGGCQLQTGEPGTYGGGSAYVRVPQTPAVAGSAYTSRKFDVLFRIWVAP